MKTIVQKDDGRFERLNISIDSLPDVDLIVKGIRDIQDHKNYSKYSDNDKFTLDSLLKECEEIAKVEPIEL